MNIVDYIIILILLLCALKGFKSGLLPTIVSLVGSILIFILAFYIKQPISVLLYENLPFLNFAGICKGVIAVNILFYEAVAYIITISILMIVFTIVKRISIGLQKIMNVTLFLNLPSKILGGVLGLIEGIIFSFVLLFIASIINTTTKYVYESKYGSIILTKTPIISNVTSDLTNSTLEIYNVIIKNPNNTRKANIESIDILMKYNILSYESANKLVLDNKLNVEGIDIVIEKYKGVE